MADTGMYTITPDAVRTVTSSVTSLLADAIGAVGNLGEQVLEGTAFATIGSPVASANTAMQGQQISAFQALLDLLKGVNGNVNTSADNYSAADTAVAQGYGNQQNAQTGQPAQQQFNLSTDQQLRSQLSQEEDPHNGRQTIYHVLDDGRGNPTVGHGYNLNQHGAAAEVNATGANYTDVRNGSADLTDAQVNQLFDNSVGRAVTTARGYYNGLDQLDPVRQRVLADMAFNMGPGTLGQFHQLHTALTNGDYNAAATAMQNSAWYTQTGTRAQRLVNEMRTGQMQP